MSAKPQHLRLVDTATGESFDRDERVAYLEDQLAGSEHEIRSWRTKYADLKRDKAKEAEESELWAEAEHLFDWVWCPLSKHAGPCGAATGPGPIPSKAKFTWQRFYLLEPYLQRHGFEVCASAIIGRCFEHFSDIRANGTRRCYNEFERIFKGPKDFEESANRRPPDWESRLGSLLEES